MQIPDPIAFVVDDDEAVRDSLGMLLRSIGSHRFSRNSTA